MSRKVTLFVAASLDGFIARRDGSIDWLPHPTAREDYGQGEFWSGVGTVLMGRRTYDAARAQDGAASFGGRRCVVFSRRRGGKRERAARFVSTDPAEFVRALRTKPPRASAGGSAEDNIWLVGGGEIVRSCLDAGVVNEVVLSIVPVLLGDGVPLFLPRGGTTWLRLLHTRSFADGLVQLTYATGVRRPPSATDDREEPNAVGDEAIKSDDGTELADTLAARETASAVGGGLVRAWAVRRWAA